MIYATTDNSGLPTGFYSLDMHGDAIPAEAISLTEDQWQECINNPGRRKITETTDGAALVEDYLPPPLSVEDLAVAALGRINGGYTRTMQVILAEYPDAETLSFDKQEKQATAWDEWQQAGAVPEDEPVTPYLDDMLLERPIGKAELVSRILAKAAQFSTAHARATGRRQRLEDDIKTAKAAKDRGALEAITW